MSSYDRVSEKSLELSDSAKAQEIQKEPVRDNFAGRLLKNFLFAMNSVGDDAEANYKEKLEELKKHSEDILVEIARAEGASMEEDYPLRWALVHAASELKHPAALRFLRNLVFSPIPPEKSKDPHSFSTVGEETILRTTAVEGVEYLSEMGVEEAKKTLFDFLELPSISIRRAAIQAIYATVKDESKLKELKSRIPKDQQYLLNIKRVEVKDVPQIKDPTKYLKEGARDAAKKVPPKVKERETTETSPKMYRREQ